MVKSLEQPRSLPSRKRVSFDSDSKTNEDCTVSLSFSVDLGGRRTACMTTGFLDCNSIESYLKVERTLNSRRRDCVERTSEIAKNIIYSHEPLPRSSAAHDQREGSRHGSSSIPHQNQETLTPCPTVNVKSPPRQSLAKIVVFSNDLKNECEDELKRVENKTLNETEIAGRPVVTSLSSTPSVPFGCDSSPSGNRAEAGVRSIGGESESSGAVVGKNSERLNPCVGYSKQRRHGRKASLGTAEITRLIPTLVSENEEFRQKEYRRKISAHNLDGSQNLTL